MRIKYLIILFFAVLIGGQSQAAENRVALVIGNSVYDHAQPLKNPGNDAKQISRLLSELGFQVIEGYNLNQTGFTKILAEYTSALQNADVALFYYAGHGIQLEDENYLVSTNARLESSLTVFGETIPLEQIIRLMESSSPVNLAFIDACRDNPFLEKLRSSLPATRSTSTNRGLAAVASVKPDTLIMFATEADNVADDGEFENSPFASALLKHVGTPNAEISQITTQIIRDVRIATDFRQNPEVQSAMGAEFYFQRDETLADDVAIEFANAKSSNSAEAWQSFIKRHRSGFFAELAKAALMEIEAGNSSFSQNTDYAQIEKQLNLGSEERKIIQKTLSALGYDIGPIDGEFGSKTRTQIRGFQKEWDLRPSGFVDKVTRAVLASEDVQKAAGRAYDATTDFVGALAEAELNLTQDEIKLVQVGLSSMGYLPESNSGVFNVATRAAIQTEQYKRGLKPDGYLSAKLAKEFIEKGRKNYAGIATYMNVREQYGADIDERLKQVVARYQERNVTLTNYAYFRNSLYIAIRAWSNPREAQKFAEHLGGHLVVFSDKAEREFVDGLVENDKRFFAIDRNYFQGPAIGYFQKSSARNRKNGWYSVTGEPMRHLNWSPESPSALRWAGKPGNAIYGGELRNYGEWERIRQNLRFSDNASEIHESYGLIFEFPPTN